MSPCFSHQWVAELLQKEIDKAGGVREYGRRISVDPSNLSGILHGRTKPLPPVLKALGLRKVTHYEPSR